MKSHLRLIASGEAPLYYRAALRRRLVRARVRRSPGGRLVFPVYDGVVATLRESDDLTLRAYMDGIDQPIVHTLERLLRPGMTVVDVGANTGLYTVICARLVGPGGRVHSFEPVPGLGGRVRENAELNGLANVEVYGSGLGARAGSFRLHLSGSGGDGWSSLYPSEWTGPEAVEVPVETLDGWMDRRDVERIDLLKVDVEGAELDVLRGARRSLAEGRIGAVVVEFNRDTQEAGGFSAEEMERTLAEAGFRWHVLPWTPGDQAPVDWAALPRLCDLVAVREGAP
ncbi:MAG TPA: FkbM family methyltransferase [Longimicrobiaceae bacterium]|nr:FkbM family methyltransferase [Longimicrobiaceae bacterium]